MSKKKIVIHHTAVSYDKNPEQFDAVNRYHISKGWGSIGYHWFIEKDGTVKHGRDETLSGAHCYQKNMNRDSIGICLCGNFDEEYPKDEQYESLRSLISNIEERNGHCEIFLHRYFATYKTCPGKNFNLNEVYMDKQFQTAIKNKTCDSIGSSLSVLWNFVSSTEDKKRIEQIKKEILDMKG